MKEVRGRHDDGRRDQSRTEDVGARALTHLGRDRRQRIDPLVPHALQRAVHALERARRLLAHEPVNGFRDPDQDERDENGRERRPEVEDRPPVVSLEQLRDDEAADHRTDRISDRHD